MKILAGHVAGMVAALALVCAPVAAQAQRGGGHGGGGGHFGGGAHVGGGGGGFRGGGGGFRGGGVYRGGGYHGGFYRGGVVYRGGYGWGGYPGWGWGWGGGLYADPWLWGWPGYYGDYPGYYDDSEQAPPVAQGAVDSYAPNAAPATPPSTACGYWQWGEDKQYHWVNNNAGNNGCQ